MNEIILDVSDLPAPQPLEMVVDNLHQIKEDTYLKVIHRMEPRLLFNILHNGGFLYDVYQESDKYYIHIYKTPKDSIVNLPAGDNNV